MSTIRITSKIYLLLKTNKMKPRRMLRALASEIRYCPTHQIRIAQSARLRTTKFSLSWRLSTPRLPLKTKLQWLRETIVDLKHSIRIRAGSQKLTSPTKPCQTSICQVEARLPKDPKPLFNFKRVQIIIHKIPKSTRTIKEVRSRKEPYLSPLLALIIK